MIDSCFKQLSFLYIEEWFKKPSDIEVEVKKSFTKNCGMSTAKKSEKLYMIL